MTDFAGEGITQDYYLPHIEGLKRLFFCPECEVKWQDKRDKSKCWVCRKTIKIWTVVPR